jgi:hypothetical protein
MTTGTLQKSAVDGRVECLPKPAINLAQRLTQLANGTGALAVQVVIVDGAWLLIRADGRAERMGRTGDA